MKNHERNRIDLLGLTVDVMSAAGYARQNAKKTKQIITRVIASRECSLDLPLKTCNDKKRNIITLLSIFE